MVSTMMHAVSDSFGTPGKLETGEGGQEKMLRFVVLFPFSSCQAPPNLCPVTKENSNSRSCST